MTFYSKILKIIFIELSKNHKMRKNVNNIHGLGFRIGPTFESFFLGPTLNLKSNHNFLQSINYFNFQFCFQSALFSRCPVVSSEVSFVRGHFRQNQFRQRPFSSENSFVRGLFRQRQVSSEVLSVSKAPFLKL